MTGKWWNKDVNTGCWLLGSCKCLQGGTSTSGMFQKHQSQAPWESNRPTCWPCTRPPVSSSLWVCIFSIKEIWRQLAGLSVGASHPSCVQGLWCSLPSRPAVQGGGTRCAARGMGVGGGGAAAATHAGPALVCFLNLGVLVGGGETFPFSDRNVTRPLIPTQRCLIISIQPAASARQLLLCGPHLSAPLRAAPPSHFTAGASQPGQWPRAHG